MPAGAAGNGTVAMDPIYASGHGTATASAAHNCLRAASASARFRAITAGQPPANCDSMNRNAADRLNTAAGSHVPAQSNSSQNRERSCRREFAP